MPIINIENAKTEAIKALHNMTNEDFLNAEKRTETKEYIKEHEEIQKQCDIIINTIQLNTLDDIQRAKELSRKIPMSAEKVLLFKYLISIEDKLKNV